MKNKTINAILITATITLLAVMAFYVKTGATADSVVVLRTTGMTCGNCSSKISRALESVKGVAATEVDQEGGWVIVSYDTKTVKPEELAEKICGTGFNSNVHQVLTPEQFRQVTGRNIGEKDNSASGCCGGNGGCGMNRPDTGK